LTDAPDVRAELVDTFADLYDQLEEFDRVAALERQRLKDLQVSDGGRPSAAKAQALAELGRALAMTGRYTEAGPTLNDALRTMDGHRRRPLAVPGTGVDHPRPRRLPRRVLE
jgi:hypothetical protein